MEKIMELIATHGWQVIVVWKTTGLVVCQSPDGRYEIEVHTSSMKVAVKTLPDGQRKWLDSVSLAQLDILLNEPLDVMI